MSWVKLDDQFPTHPKIITVGGDAAWLHVCALCYCGQHLTDGKVPRAMLDRLSDRKNVAGLTARLLNAGVWIDRGDEIELHGYLDYNPSREQVLAEREKRSKAGVKGAAKRWGSSSHGTSHGTTHTNRIDNVDAPVPSRPDVPTEPNKRARGQQPDETFQPTDRHCEFARTNGLNLQREVDHWVADCQAKGRAYDRLNAGFSTWLHNAVNFGRGGAPVAVDVSEPSLVLPPARVETCPTCDSSLLACHCVKATA